MFGILRGNKKNKSYRKRASSVYSMEEDVPCFLPEDFNFRKTKEGDYVFDKHGFQEDMQDIFDALQCQGGYDDDITVYTRKTKSNKSVTQNKNVDLTLESPTDLVRSLSNVIMGVESDDGNSLETYDDNSTKKKKRFSKWTMFRKRKNTIDEESVINREEHGFAKIVSDLSFGAIDATRFMKKDSEDREDEESIDLRQKAAYYKPRTRSSPSVKRSVASRASSPNRARLNTAPSRISSRAQSSAAKHSLAMRSAPSVASRKSNISRATSKSRMSRKATQSTKAYKSPLEKPELEKNTATSVNIVQGLGSNRRKQSLASPLAKKEVTEPGEFIIAISDDGDKENDDISILTDDPKLKESTKKQFGKSSMPSLESRGSDNNSTAISYKNPKYRNVQKTMQKARARIQYDENYLESLPKDSFKQDQKRKNRSSAKNKYADETSVVVTTRSSQGRVVKNMVSLKSGLR